MPARTTDTVERRIFFYKAITAVDEEGRDVPLDVASAVRYIDSLPFTPEGRYLDDAEGNGISLVVDGPRRFRLAAIRRSGLPLLERAGALSPLGIPLQSGLFEPTHIVLFDRSIIGAEFNFYGPRVSRLPKYLTEKARGRFRAFTLATLARSDVLDRLSEFADIRGIDLRVRASAAEDLKRANRDLGTALELAARTSGAQSVEFVLKPRPRSRDHLADRMLTTLRKIVQRANFREEFDKLQIRGVNATTNQVEPLDLLRDDLIATREILKVDVRTRAVNSASMFTAIEDAERALRSELLEAAEIST